MTSTTATTAASSTALGNGAVNDDELDFSDDDDLRDGAVTPHSVRSAHSSIRDAMGGDQDLLIYDGDTDKEDMNSDDEIIFEELDEEEVARIGREKFKIPECLIKTTATIVVQKRKEDLDEQEEREAKRPKSALLSAFTRKAIPFLVLPRSCIGEETLNEKFSKHNEWKMKRHITPNQALLSYLRLKGEAGFKKAFGPKAGGIDDKKLEEKLTKRQEMIEGGARPVMTDAILHNIRDNKEVDHEMIWRHNIEQWIQLYEWKRHDGPEVSKEELDREIEEWMARGGNFETGEEMEHDLEEFMREKGFVHADREQLDAELDDYWAKKGQKSHDDDAESISSTVKSFDVAAAEARAKRFQDKDKDDLDADLDAFVSQKKGSGSNDEIAGLSIDAALPSHVPISEEFQKKAHMTPQERMRQILQRKAKELSAADLDADLETWGHRQKEKSEAEKKAQKETEEAAKKKLEEEAKAAAETDIFAGTDFGGDDEMEVGEEDINAVW